MPQSKKRRNPRCRGVAECFSARSLSLEQVVSEISTALIDFPDLRISQSDRFPVTLEGSIILSGSKGPFDSFNVRIEFQDGFPLIAPQLFETSGRLPREIDRHIFSDGHACLAVWEAWLARTDDWSVGATLNGPIRNFLLSQSEFERTGKWPFGEHAHGSVGQLDAIKAIIDPEAIGASRVVWIVDTLFKWPAGHISCPCGSGRRFRHCHRSELEVLRARLEPLTVYVLHLAVEKYRAFNQRIDVSRQIAD